MIGPLPQDMHSKSFTVNDMPTKRVDREFAAHVRCENRMFEETVVDKRKSAKNIKRKESGTEGLI